MRDTVPSHGLAEAMDHDNFYWKQEAAYQCLGYVESCYNLPAQFHD
jgi:hypothetical protein